MSCYIMIFLLNVYRCEVYISQQAKYNQIENDIKYSLMKWF